MVFNQFVSSQTFIVDRVLSIPRISLFLQEEPLLKTINWKNLIKSYYYSTLDSFYELEPDNAIYLFVNLWEIFQKSINSLSPSELNPILLTCARVASYLSPRLLETDPSACISEPLNRRVVRKQLTQFTETSRISSLFIKILDYNVGFTDQFDLISAQCLCEIYDSFYEKCLTVKEAAFVVTGIMGGIAFNKTVIMRLWKLLQSFCDFSVFLKLDQFTGKLPTEVLGFVHVFSLFCHSYYNVLCLVDEQEFPYILTDGDAVLFTAFLVNFVHYALLVEPYHQIIEKLLKSTSRLLKLLQEFNAKLKFLDDAAFILPKKQVAKLLRELGTSQVLSRAIEFFPFAIPFTERVTILYSLIADCKQHYSAEPPIPILIRRENLVPDSITRLLSVPDIRGKLYIQFVNSFGMIEEGVDAGGLFKEFWTSLSAEVFNPEHGLFSFTTDQCLYPNPDSKLFYGSEHLPMFYLVGRILGKAIYEKITVAPKFAEFFLRKMIGKINFLEDIRSLDYALYQNLKFLKKYEGNAEDLTLAFTASTSAGEEIELKTDGKNIDVTNANKLEYIHKLSDFRLNRQIKDQCNAFFKGFNEIVQKKWTKMFTSSEMQILISGTSETLNVEDLKRFTHYIDCSARDAFVKNFWTVLDSFSSQEQALLLQFVTGCPRAPLFGFANLHPAFTISKVAIRSDSEKLPSAQTCVNTLRLPTYGSKKAMKLKLLYAINAGAGFDFQ